MKLNFGPDAPLRKRSVQLPLSPMIGTETSQMAWP